jgi:hypothetical protein
MSNHSQAPVRDVNSSRASACLAHGSVGAKSALAFALEVTRDRFYKFGTGKGILKGLCARSLLGSYSEKRFKHTHK